MRDKELPESNPQKAAETPADRSARVTAQATVWMVVLNFPLAVAAAVGLWFSHQTLVEQRASAKSAEQTFQADERSWIVILPLTMIKPNVDGKGVTVSYSYELRLQNTGKTAAHSVVVKFLSFQDSPDFEKKIDDIAAIQDKAHFGDSLKPKTVKSEVFSPPVSSPAALAPAEIVSVTQLLTGRVPEYQQHLEGWISYLVGRVDYIDAFGVPHSLQFCQFVVDDGKLRYCTSGNDRDPDPVNPAPGSG